MEPTQNPTPQFNNPIEPTKKSHRILVLSLTILLTAGAIGGGTYYVLGQQIKKQNESIAKLETANSDLKKSVNKTEKTDEKKVEAPIIKDETADWKSYSIQKYKINFKYPTDWAVIDDSTKENGEQFYILDTSENYIVVKKESEKKAIVINTGNDPGGRGGLCTKRNVTYSSIIDSATKRMSLKLKKDETDSSITSYCSEGTNGFEVRVEYFKYQNIPYYIISYGDGTDDEMQEQIKLFKQIAETITFN